MIEVTMENGHVESPQDDRRAIVTLMLHEQRAREWEREMRRSDRETDEQWRKDQATLALHVRDVVASIGSAAWCLVVIGALAVAVAYGRAIYLAVAR